MKKYSLLGVLSGLMVFASLFFFIGRSVGIDKMANEIILEPSQEATITTEGYIDTDEQFEKEMVERLAEFLEDSEGDIKYEQNAAGRVSITIHLSWDNRD